MSPVAGDSGLLGGEGGVTVVVVTGMAAAVRVAGVVSAVVVAAVVGALC